LGTKELSKERKALDYHNQIVFQESLSTETRMEVA
jgi:hypothetical protein